MLLRIRRSLLKFGILELALLVAILVSVARFKGITVAPNRAAPADSSFWDSRIIMVVDDSPREGVTTWSKNEGTSEPYVLGGSKINCNSRGKRRKQLEKKMTPTTPTATTGVSNAGLAFGGEPGVGVLRIVARIRRGARPLSVEKGGTA